MNSPSPETNKKAGAFQLFFAAALISSFFLPWISWNSTQLSGAAMPLGHVMGVAESQFGVPNPFPQFNFAYNLFWLIPVGAILVLLAALSGRKASLVAFLCGALSLGLLAFFYLFTAKIIFGGADRNILSLVCPGGWAQLLAAIGLIISASGSPLKKIIWIVIGPVFAYASFALLMNYFMEEQHDDTKTVQADYTVTATALITEFIHSDSTANKKYREKILVVNGTVSEVSAKADSTVNIRFADSTGSNLSFALEKTEYPKAKNIKTGDAVSIKGSCSGGVYSDILEAESITFKRCVLTN